MIMNSNKNFKKITIILIPFLQSLSGIWTKQSKILFLSHFCLLLKEVVLFEAAWAVAKIGWSFKPNHTNQAQLFRIPDMHCTKINYRGGEFKNSFLFIS